MGRLRISFAITVMFAGALGAQTVIPGVRGGVTLARQYDDHGPSSQLIGVTVGPSLTLEAVTWFSFEADLLYTQKGWRRDATWVGLDYFELPVLVRLAIPLTDIDAGPDLGLQPFMIAGVAGAMLLRCQSSLGFAVVNGSNPLMRHFPSNCSAYDNPQDASVVYGWGVTLRRVRQHITLEMRRTRGVSDLRMRRPVSCQCRRLTNDVTSIFVVAALKVK